MFGFRLIFLKRKRGHNRGIKADDFRFGYRFKTPCSQHAFDKNDTQAETKLIPIFPTLTFPNHYSIVIGLYPPHDGIVNNVLFGPLTGEKFMIQSHS